MVNIGKNFPRISSVWCLRIGQALNDERRKECKEKRSGGRGRKTGVGGKRGDGEM